MQYLMQEHSIDISADHYLQSKLSQCPLFGPMGCWGPLVEGETYDYGRYLREQLFRVGENTAWAMGVVF